MGEIHLLSITAISNLPVQIFEHSNFVQNPKGKLSIYQDLDSFRRQNFSGVCTLTRSPTSTNDGGMITIPRQDHELFKVLNSRREDVEKAVAALSGKKKKGGNEIELGTDDEED
jgi:hypothetical protein